MAAALSTWPSLFGLWRCLWEDDGTRRHCSLTSSSSMSGYAGDQLGVWAQDSGPAPLLLQFEVRRDGELGCERVTCIRACYGPRNRRYADGSPSLPRLLVLSEMSLERGVGNLAVAVIEERPSQRGSSIVRLISGIEHLDSRDNTGVGRRTAFRMRMGTGCLVPGSPQPFVRLPGRDQLLSLGRKMPPWMRSVS